MALHQNVGGTWKALTAWINVAGTWKKAAVWQNVDGVWKQITSLATPSASLPSVINGISFLAGGPTISLNLAGTWSASGGQSGTWLTTGANTDFEARASNLTGNTANATGTYDSWLPLSSTRTWGLTGGVVGSYRSTTFTLEIRLAASPYTVLTTSTVTLEADRT